MPMQTLLAAPLAKGTKDIVKLLLDCFKPRFWSDSIRW
jgi:hypothetical protein